MDLKEGKYTIERFAFEQGLAKQSALNLLSKLKRQNKVSVSGGGKQKRIYTVYAVTKKQPNGFFTIVNKYSPEKLNPSFDHYVHGAYTIERAIIDGISIGDARTKDATMHLFRHVTNWKRLMDLAKKAGLERAVITLYERARTSVKCKRMPGRYL